MTDRLPLPPGPSEKLTGFPRLMDGYPLKAGGSQDKRPSNDLLRVHPAPQPPRGIVEQGILFYSRARPRPTGADVYAIPSMCRRMPQFQKAGNFGLSSTLSFGISSVIRGIEKAAWRYVVARNSHEALFRLAFTAKWWYEISPPIPPTWLAGEIRYGDFGCYT